MEQNFSHRIKNWFKRYNKHLVVFVGTLLVGLIIFQVFVFSDRLPLFSKIDGQKIGGWTSEDTSNHLQNLYANSEVDMYVKSAEQPFATIKAKDIGLSAEYNNKISESIMPLWLRLIPSSVLWSHFLNNEINPEYKSDEQKVNSFVTKQFGEECHVAPKNATLSVKDQEITIVRSQDGGDCKRSEVEKTLKESKASIEKTARIEVPVTPIAPNIKDSQAKELKKIIDDRLNKPISVVTVNKQVPIEKEALIEWLDFDNSGQDIVIKISPEKSEKFIKEQIAPLVLVAAGTTKVTTHDFQQTARIEGQPGKALNYEATRTSISEYLTGKNEKIEAKAIQVPAKIQYTRNYSNTDKGLSALLKHNAEDRPGRIGVSMIELSGQRRRASYNGDMQFTTASTYKLFVAYSVLKRVENGQMSWSDQVDGGRNLDKCFDDMIVLSDNPCPQALVKRIGHSAVQADVKELGMKSTNFLDADSYKTTPNDLAQFTAMLESRQLPISRASQDKLINAMRRNVYRQGIPAGSKGPVADKVGFLDALLHDAAIVYSPSGTYALAIMTDGSSWAEIAALTRKIEELRG